jgi:hypothetical protein
MGYDTDKTYSKLKPVGNTPLGIGSGTKKRSNAKNVDPNEIEEDLTKVTEGEKQRQH